MGCDQLDLQTKGKPPMKQLKQWMALLAMSALLAGNILPVLAQDPALNPPKTQELETEAETEQGSETETDPGREEETQHPAEESKSRKGSLTIALEPTATGRPRQDVVFGVVQVADLQNGDLILREDFAQSGVDLESLSTADQLEQAARRLMELAQREEHTLITNEQGESERLELEAGVYLVYVLDFAGYEYITPFLVSIPTWNEAGGVMDYDMSLMPKHAPLPCLELEKVDARTGQNITGKRVEFTLYQDREQKQVLDVLQLDENTGRLSLELDMGTFWIRETSAPAGYRLSDEVVKVDVAADGLRINDRLVEVPSSAVVTITYRNEQDPIYPLRPSTVMTSVASHPVLWTTLAAGSALILITLVFRSRKRKENRRPSC